MTELIGDICIPSNLIIPQVTETVRDTLANKAGSIIFNTTSGKLNFNTGSGWEAVTSA